MRAASKLKMDQLVARMDMGGGMKSSQPACKISMLWNWYTVDTCFLSRSWHNHSKGAFAGSCIGVFFLVMASQWLHRFAREYDTAIIRRSTVRSSGLSEYKAELDSQELPVIGGPNPAVHAAGHRWLFAPSVAGVVALNLEHVIRSVLFAIEWGLSYIIMLLFMYYNGYIIICCILGALCGRLLFTYREPLNGSCLEDAQDMDKKCCR